MTRPLLRTATAADQPAISAIYAHHVLHGLASVGTDPPTLAEMTRRFESITGAWYPYLVAVQEGVVLGYACAGPHRMRPAYRFTIEDPVYAAPAAARRGIGRALVMRLVAECEECGCRQMLAVIGDSDNHASIGLHRACGFTLKCTLGAVGFKRGRWIDSVIMQRGLARAIEACQPIARRDGQYGVMPIGHRLRWSRAPSQPLLRCRSKAPGTIAYRWLHGICRR
jgi:phosphinothricin acetyltransferase